MKTGQQGNGQIIGTLKKGAVIWSRRDSSSHRDPGEVTGGCQDTLHQDPRKNLPGIVVIPETAHNLVRPVAATIPCAFWNRGKKPMLGN